MKRNKYKRKVMAYIYMPLFFTIIGYGVIFLAFSPFLNTVSSIINLVTSDTDPDFHTELKNIYEIPATGEKDTVSVQDVTMPASETLYAHISCGRIGLDAPLYFGDTNAVLKVGVGQYTGTSLPGFGKPILLAAHNTTYFLPLEDIESGDIVEINTSYGNYEYCVTDMQVADKNDTSAYDLSQEKEQLIMYTCYPFRMLGNLQDRYFVYCDKVSGPEVTFD